jgi:PAS domain-containing protein
MVSVNEELQSINEELETSKEELQSVNEELRTVNLELSGKVEELDRANADLRNLFDSTQVATVFLDRHLVIRSFTPAVTAIFNLVAADRGRPLTDFASRLDRVVSAPGGRVTVTWAEEDGGEVARLLLRWAEEGGPPVVDQPGRRGFGSELIERQLRPTWQERSRLPTSPAGCVPR